MICPVPGCLQPACVTPYCVDHNEDDMPIHPIIRARIAELEDENRQLRATIEMLLEDDEDQMGDISRVEDTL